jgi:hypothetical protein
LDEEQLKWLAEELLKDMDQRLVIVAISPLLVPVNPCTLPRHKITFIQKLPKDFRIPMRLLF